MLSYGVDAKSAEFYSDTEYEYDPMDPNAGMTPAQIAKQDELRSMFNQLRAEVSDKNEEDDNLWDVDT